MKIAIEDLDIIKGILSIHNFNFSAKVKKTIVFS